jgi:hypothetical protein
MPKAVVSAGPSDRDQPQTRLTSAEAVGGLRKGGMRTHELVPRCVQEGTFLVPGLIGASVGRGVEVPILGHTWACDRGVVVEEAIRGCDIRELLVTERTTTLNERVGVVHAGKVAAVEGIHL